MKTKILLALMLLTACETRKTKIEGEKIETINLDNSTISTHGVQILIIDGCEYVWLHQNGAGLTHKGNCKYCVKRGF